MFRRTLGLLTAAGILTLLSGCLLVHHRHHRGPRHVPPGHAKKFHHHVHGVGCGHVFRGGRWVLVVEVD